MRRTVAATATSPSVTRFTFIRGNSSGQAPNWAKLRKRELKLVDFLVLFNLKGNIPDLTSPGPQSIDLKIKTSLVGNFVLVERRVLNTPARPCQEDQSYSFTRCLLEFVAARVGCHLDLAGTHRLPQYPPCKSLAEIEEYSHLLEQIKDFSWVRLTRETSCYGKCRYKEYKFSKVTLEC